LRNLPGQDALDLDFAASRAGQSQARSRRVGQVDDPIVEERSAVVDPHDHRAASRVLVMRA